MRVPERYPTDDRFPTTDGVDEPFGDGDLARLRADVGDFLAARFGAGDEEWAARVLLVVTELATNVIRHGGGTGRLRVKAVDGEVVCEVTDAGPGIDDAAMAATGPGAGAPAPTALGGRGLWLCRHLTDRLAVETGPIGTTVTGTFIPRPDDDGPAS